MSNNASLLTCVDTATSSGLREGKRLAQFYCFASQPLGFSPVFPQATMFRVIEQGSDLNALRAD